MVDVDSCDLQNLESNELLKELASTDIESAASPIATPSTAGSVPGPPVATGSADSLMSVGLQSAAIDSGNETPQQLSYPIMAKCIATPIPRVPLLRPVGRVQSKGVCPAVSPQMICMAPTAVSGLSRTDFATVPCANMHDGKSVSGTAHVHMAQMCIPPQAIKLIPGSPSPQKRMDFSLPPDRSSRHPWSRESSPMVRRISTRATSSAIRQRSVDTKPSTSSLSLSAVVNLPAPVDLSRSCSMLNAQRIAPENCSKQSSESIAITTTKEQHEVERDRHSVVFLDIDGVLHPWQSNTLFCRECCLLFERIMRRTCAVTVLSSTWRKFPSQIAMVENILKLLKLDPIYGFTLDFGKGVESRGEEILEWLGRHPEVKNWIAIDDMDLTDSLMPCGHLLRGHFVHTNPDTGILPTDVDLAVHLLGGDVHVVVKV